MHDAGHRRPHAHVHARVHGTAEGERRHLQPTDKTGRTGGDLSPRHPGRDPAARPFRLRTAPARHGRRAHRHGDRLADLPQRLLGNRGRQLRGGARIQRQHGSGTENLARPYPLVHLTALGISATGRGRAQAELRCRRGRGDGAGQHRRPQPDRSVVRTGLGSDRSPRSARAGASDRPARHRRNGHEEIRPQLVGGLHRRHHARVHPHHLRRLPRPVSEPEADRLARRRRAALSGRPLRQGRRGGNPVAAPGEGAAVGISQAHLVRLHHLSSRRPCSS